MYSLREQCSFTKYLHFYSIQHIITMENEKMLVLTCLTSALFLPYNCINILFPLKWLLSFSLAFVTSPILKFVLYIFRFISALFALLYLILSFYILTFISFNFYLSYFGIILSKLLFWFIFFPIVLVVACWSFFVSYTDYNNKPVFGSDTCWFDRKWIYIVATIK